MIKLTIDGQAVEVEEGTSVLQAAQKLGIEIPTLCYNKALTPYGACRLCIVEIGADGAARTHASCLYQATEGLVVRTNTPRVQSARKIMAELMLARCPESKEVQEIAAALGVKEPRIEKKNKDCTLCGLCVRMCEERMGQSAVSFIERGSKREVKPPFDMTSEACQTCGACVFICPNNAIKLERVTKNTPVPIPNDFDMGLAPRPVIHVRFPQAVPNTALIDKEHCVHLQEAGECGICKDVCIAKAIDFDQQEETLNLNVGAVILAPGYSFFDPRQKSVLEYKRSPNVISSMEFERILNASGPFQGHVQRLSDGKTPKKIAWLQCVGSRDQVFGNGYCSSVCCTYAVKEAIIAKEHVGRSLETVIFYMDMRTYGKDFDKYRDRAETEYGVRFVRSTVPYIEEVPETKNLMVTYETEEGDIKREEFDLIVLSVGFNPPEYAEELARKLGIRLNEYGYCETSRLNPLETTRPGIFVCGGFSGPKDIPETVMQASGAAAAAESILPEARNKLVKVKEYPPETDVRGQEPRIGVFICHCGINIGGFLDVPAVVEYAKTIPNVVFADQNLFTCSEDTQRKIKETIQEHKLNRVVVASCTPRTHEPLFQETLREAGLNAYLFEMANIRDQCSWIHMFDREEATRKAKDLVRMAIAKARLIEPLATIPLNVTQKALVIGGGVAGMVSALKIAEQGYEVYIVEREKELGGNMRNILRTVEGDDVRRYLASVIKQVESNPLIHVYKSSEVEKVQGFVGNYKSTIRRNGSLPQSPERLVEVEHGAVVVAIGAQESRPKEYLYGKHRRVVGQVELEKRLDEDPAYAKRLNNVVMIQCVGSRDSDHPYCSRVCCSEAVRNALRIKENNPGTDVFILYRDVRTYGFREEYYRKAREAGVIFIRYEEREKPELIVQGDALKVSVRDPVLNCRLILDADLLVLSLGAVPHADAKKLAEMLKVPLNDDGFFLEAHVKLRPVDFATEGVFLAGIAHSPKFIDETIAQANAAASRACTILCKDKYEAEPTIAVVNEDICDGCGICEPVCEYNAIKMVTESRDGKEAKKALLTEALCKGCGGCIAACPSGAMEQKGFKSEQMMAMIDAALSGQTG